MLGGRDGDELQVMYMGRCEMRVYFWMGGYVRGELSM